jgi:hypothetical protein
MGNAYTTLLSGNPDNSQDTLRALEELSREITSNPLKAKVTIEGLGADDKENAAETNDEETCRDSNGSITSSFV